MKNRYLLLLFTALLFVISLHAGEIAAQSVTAQELAKALKECEDDLGKSKKMVIKLQHALQQTDTIFDKRKTYTDSLVSNLKSQLDTQDSISVLMKANADTMHLMIEDYGKKLDEVSDLYVKVLQTQGRPWWLNSKGWKGFFYGILIGGAVGVTYCAAK